MQSIPILLQLFIARKGAIDRFHSALCGTSRSPESSHARGASAPAFVPNLTVFHDSVEVPEVVGKVSGDNRPLVDELRRQLSDRVCELRLRRPGEWAETVEPGGTNRRESLGRVRPEDILSRKLRSRQPCLHKFV